MENEVLVEFEDATDNLYPALFKCFTIIICGYIAGRLNAVSPTESKGIATFVGTFALPSLIFLSLAKLDFSTVNWDFLLAILLAKGIVFFGVMIVTMLVSKPLNLGRAGMFAIFCTQSNDFALGYPIINALYRKTHPEYALYLYLMAPISLAILNPVAFILMEINKQKEQTQIVVEGESKANVCKVKLIRQILKGIAFNPVLVMTILGILGNIIFKHKLSVYLEELLEVFGQSFAACALFLLGLRMVGQIHGLRGPALLLPCVLIMVKLIVLPVVMREGVNVLKAGENETETLSLSTYAFLYGTIPTAPAVFVFSNLYQLEIDLMASSMVICTFLSAPIMFITAQLISINKDYAEQMKRFGFDLSIVALITTIWVLFVFTVTKKYKRMPHRLTLCLIVSQFALAISVIWGGPLTNYTPSWYSTVQQALRIFSMYSCLLWTSMLSVGILMLESRGPCFVVTLWPVLGFVAWGAPAVMIVVLFATNGSGDLECKATDAIRLCLLVFCLTVTAGCLILYMRLRRRHASLIPEASPTSSRREESASLVENAEPISQSHASINGCYGTITSSPSPKKQANCCSNDPNCQNGLTTSEDIEDLGNSVKAQLLSMEFFPSFAIFYQMLDMMFTFSFIWDCACTPTENQHCTVENSCEYLDELDRAANSLGLLPPEQNRGRGGQILKHVVLIIVYSLNMFIGITYTTWSMMSKDEGGIFVEIQFLDIVANYGQALVMFILFGLDPEEIIIPTVKFIKNYWYGGETVVLPPIDELSFETKHVCDQFITHHIERCKEAIAKDTRWRMRSYRRVFRGSCLVRWLVDCGLARDAHDAVQYGRHLLDGRLIAHINDAHHFTNSPLLYTFK